MEGSERPRRALGPLPDDLGDPVVDSTAPAGPLIDDADLTDTGMMRRLAMNPDGTLMDLVPPPRPVLPSSEAALPASAGRRFSADDSYEAEWAAPRRSAASVASPPSQYEPLLPPVSRPTQPPPVTVAYQPSASRAAEPTAFSMAAPELGSHALTPEPVEPESAPTVDKAAEKEAAAEAKADAKRAKAEAKADARAAKADAKAAAKAAKAAAAEAKKTSKNSPSQPSIAARLSTAEAPPSPTPDATAKPEKSARSVRPAFLVIAAVVVLILVISLGVVYVLRPASSSGATAPGAVDPILTDADVNVIGAGPWTSAATTQGAICLSGGTTVKADRSVSRLLSNTSESSVLQTVDSYADVDSATEAFNQRLTQLGTCADGTGMVQSASTVKGLGAAASAVMVKAHKGDATHTVLLVRSNRTVNVFDAATPAAIPLTVLANTATASLNRQCTGTECPTTISIEATVPAAGDPPGYLVPGDLPLPNEGVGKWDAVDLATVKAPGSSCEGVSLSRVSGATQAGQRTLVLTGDPAAGSEVFGMDQVSYTFPTAKAAQAFAATLTKSLTTCAPHPLTFTLEHSEKVTGTGAKSVPITGQTWRFSHGARGVTAVFRVAVVTGGNRVTYLMANPLKKLDVSNAEWTAIALRAGQRASQV